MRIRILITITALLAALTGCTSGAGGYTNVKLETSSHYSTNGFLYATEEHKKDIGIVFLHGKRGNPDTDHNNRFISNMRSLGYQVIAPIMPWSEIRGYNGTRSQGIEIIHAAVNLITEKRVVVIGHSMGGMAVFQYGANSISSKVAGLVSVAPGHDPNNALKLKTHTYFDAKKACEMMAGGKGKERSRFSDMNSGKKYAINATAEYYCTYYNVNEYPDSLRVSSNIKTPTFILSGSDDRLTQIYSHEEIFNSLPKNDKNKYEEMTGNHREVLFKHTSDISQWIDSL